MKTIPIYKMNSIIANNWIRFPTLTKDKFNSYRKSFQGYGAYEIKKSLTGGILVRRRLGEFPLCEIEYCKVETELDLS